MAPSLQVQISEAIPPAVALDSGFDDSHWFDCTTTARQEARLLFGLIGRNGDTVESLRELIAVPPEIESALRAYMREEPEDSDGIERVLHFRRSVAQEFEELIATTCVQE